MLGINRVTILGHLGKDPELKTSANGKTYTNLSVATRRPMGKKEAEMEEITDWHIVTVWGATGERCVQYLKSGQLVHVEGFLSEFKSSEENMDSPRRIGITASNVQFLSPKPMSQRAMPL